MFWLCIAMEILMITNSCWLLFYLEDIIDVDSFRIKFFEKFIQVWSQVKEFLIEHFNNFKALSDTQKFTTLLNRKDILLLVRNLKAVKFAVTSVFNVAIDIEM